MTLKLAVRFRQTWVVMIKKSLITVMITPLLASALSAQAAKTQAMLMAMRANGKQMAPYQWKQRITVNRNGISSGTIIEEIRFDATGQLQRVTLAKPEEKRMGPLRARKAAEIKDSVQEVMQLAGQYASPQQLSQAIQKGEIWEGRGALRVQARSLILQTDEMTMLVDAATYLASRIDIKTEHEGSPVNIGFDYQKLPNGPSMMTRMTAQIIKEGVVVNVESFDFVRLAVPNVQ